MGGETQTRSRSFAFVFAPLAVLLLVLGACSSGSPIGEPSGEAATISHIHGLAVDKAGVLYVATHHGLIKRAADGWVYAGPNRDDHMGFTLHPRDGVMYRSGHSMTKPALGVQTSRDAGEWTHLSDVADPPVDFHAMTVSFADSRTLWGWDSGGRGAFRSTDGGKIWTGLTPRGLPGAVFTLAGPPERDTVLAATAQGLFRSADAGAVWQPVDGTLDGWVYGLAADPEDAKHLLIYTKGGAKVSRDGGRTWTLSGKGLPAGAEIAHMTISPVDSDVAYAADSTRVFTTSDGGASWTALA